MSEWDTFLKDKSLELATGGHSFLVYAVLQDGRWQVGLVAPKAPMLIKGLNHVHARILRKPSIRHNTCQEKCMAGFPASGSDLHRPNLPVERRAATLKADMPRADQRHFDKAANGSAIRR